MSALARPGVLASVLTAAALLLHPAVGASRWLPGHEAVLAALLLLAALALVGRAAAAREAPLGPWLLASGAVLLVGALGVDGLRGHHGTLTLAPGQSRGNFEEAGPDGRPLGLRPLGFGIGVESIRASGPAPEGAPGRVVLALPGSAVPVELTPERAVGFGGYRFARPLVAATGGAARLRVAASDGQSTVVADVAPGAPGRAGDLTIALEEYFPDFALDEKQQPFSRSPEPRNPAAVLNVARGGQTYRAFVLRSMPGVHRVEGLGLAFSLLEVEPERAAEIAVHQEPGAPVALAGALLLLAGAALSFRRVSLAAPPVDPDSTLLVAAGALVSLLALWDRGSVLAWVFAVPTAAGRTVLPGVGVALGAAFLAGLAGGLLLVAGRLAGEGERVLGTARAALWLALGLTGAGLALAVARVAALPSAAGAVLPLLALAAAAVALAGSLLLTGPAAAPALPVAMLLAQALAIPAALALAIAAAVSGMMRDGTYASPFATAAAAAALLGLSAAEPTRAPALRGFLFLLALLALAVA
jgi:hypothetical protein